MNTWFYIRICRQICFIDPPLPFIWPRLAFAVVLYYLIVIIYSVLVLCMVSSWLLFRHETTAHCRSTINVRCHTSAHTSCSCAVIRTPNGSRTFRHRSFVHIKKISLRSFHPSKQEDKIRPVLGVQNKFIITLSIFPFPSGQSLV